MPSVKVPGVGSIGFPDDMTPQQIKMVLDDRFRGGPLRDESTVKTLAGKVLPVPEPETPPGFGETREAGWPTAAVPGKDTLQTGRVDLPQAPPPPAAPPMGPAPQGGIPPDIRQAEQRATQRAEQPLYLGHSKGFEPTTQAPPAAGPLGQLMAHPVETVKEAVRNTSLKEAMPNTLAALKPPKPEERNFFDNFFPTRIAQGFLADIGKSNQTVLNPVVDEMAGKAADLTGAAAQSLGANPTTTAVVRGLAKSPGMLVKAIADPEMIKVMAIPAAAAAIFPPAAPFAAKAIGIKFAEEGLKDFIEVAPQIVKGGMTPEQTEQAAERAAGDLTMILGPLAHQVGSNVKQAARRNEAYRKGVQASEDRLAGAQAQLEAAQERDRFYGQHLPEEHPALATTEDLVNQATERVREFGLKERPVPKMSAAERVVNAAQAINKLNPRDLFNAARGAEPGTEALQGGSQGTGIAGFQPFRIKPPEKYEAQIGSPEFVQEKPREPEVPYPPEWTRDEEGRPGKPGPPPEASRAPQEGPEPPGGPGAPPEGPGPVPGAPGEERPPLERRTGETWAPEGPERRTGQILVSESTGLPNWRAFDEDQAKEPAGTVAVVDVKGLKDIADQQGEGVAERYRTAQAKALKAAAEQEGATAYHFYGDDRAETFVVRAPDPETASRIVQDANLFNTEKTSNLGINVETGIGASLADATKALGRLREPRRERQPVVSETPEAGVPPPLETKPETTPETTPTTPVAPTTPAETKPAPTEPATQRATDFDTLASGQRGEPEKAMNRLAMYHGGGLFPYIAEHVGDLTHRMSEKWDFLKGGYENVKDKVEKTLRMLNSEYGFEREARENAVNNAKARGTPQEEYDAKVDALATAYADAHRKLPVYNDMQRLARDAAVAVGERNFDQARTFLGRLKDELDKGRDNWERVSGEHPQVEKPSVTAPGVPPARQKPGSAFLGRPEPEGKAPAPTTPTPKAAASLAEVPDLVRGLAEKATPEELAKALADPVIGPAVREALKKKAAVPTAESEQTGTAREANDESWVQARGPEGAVFTAEGQKIPHRWVAARTKDVVTSHNIFGQANPAFKNKELQNRQGNESFSTRAERVKVGHEQMRPADSAMLTFAPTVNDGAPLVMPNGEAAGGNARAVGLHEAIKAGITEYPNEIKDIARKLGFPEEEIAKFTPDTALYRMIDPEYAATVEKARLARDTNVSTGAELSADEKGRSDLRVILSPRERERAVEIFAKYQPGEDAYLGAPKNRDFVRALTAAFVPTNEQAGMFTSGGELSKKGRDRILGATVAAAFGDSPTVEHLLVGGGEEFEGLANGLIEASPALARVKVRQSAGDLAEVDVLRPITEAVEFIDNARASGRTVDTMLNGVEVKTKNGVIRQQDLQAPRPSPEAMELINFFEANKRNKKAVRDLMERIAEATEKSGGPEDMPDGLFNGEEINALLAERSTPSEIIAAAKRGYENDRAIEAARRAEKRQAAEAKAAGEAQPGLVGSEAGEAGEGGSAPRAARPEAAAPADTRGTAGQPGEERGGQAGEAGETGDSGAGSLFPVTESSYAPGARMSRRGERPPGPPGVRPPAGPPDRPIRPSLDAEFPVILAPPLGPIEPSRRAAALMLRPKLAELHRRHAEEKAMMDSWDRYFDLPDERAEVRAIDPKVNARITGIIENYKRLADEEVRKAQNTTLPRKERKIASQKAKEYRRAALRAEENRVGLAFQDAAEEGGERISNLSDVLRRPAIYLYRAWAARRQELSQVGIKRAESWNDYYFPHVWTDPDAAAKMIEAYGNPQKRLRGEEAFAHARTVKTILDGMERGLIPVDFNPIRTALSKMAEIDKSILMRRFQMELKARGFLTFSPATGAYKKPAGTEFIDDPAFEVWGDPNIPVKEAVDQGRTRGLLRFANSLNLPVTYNPEGTSRARPRWGGYTYGGGQGDSVMYRFGSSESTLAHEIGHGLEERYKLYNRIYDAWNGRFVGRELRALADLRLGEDMDATQPSAYRTYVRKRPELIANAIHAYVFAPDLLTETAPHVRAALDRIIGAEPDYTLNLTPEARQRAAQRVRVPIPEEPGNLRFGLRLPRETQGALFDEMRAVQPIPELSGLKDIKPSLALEEQGGYVNAQGQVLKGRFYMPAEMAGLVQTFLKRSDLDSSNAYRRFRDVSNAMLLARLGWSGFHWGLTTMDMATSGLALAGTYVSRGEFAKAAKSIAAIPKHMTLNSFRDSPYMKEYYKPGSQNAEVGAIVDSLVEGGARARQSELYSLGAWEDFFRGLRQAGVGSDVSLGEAPLRATGQMVEGALRHPIKGAKEIAGHPIRTTKALMELGSRWVLNTAVPRQKMLVGALLAERELVRFQKETGAKTLAEALERTDPMRVRDAVGRAWDSVDNRYGQVVYDNLFMNKTLRAALHATIQSVGWNLGTWRELGGGALDIAKVFKPAKDITGKDLPRITDRLAYTIALPFVHALASSVVQYLYTGELPDWEKDRKDFFFPRTGKLNPDGSPMRISPASYMKDVFGLFGGFTRGIAHGVYQATGTAIAKAHPIWAMGGELYKNEDFYGTQILTPGLGVNPAGIAQNLMELMHYLMKSVTPYSVTGYERSRKLGLSPLEAAPAFVGFPPASKRITSSDLMSELGDWVREHQRGGARSQRETHAAELAQQAREAARGGDRETLRAVQKELKEGWLLSPTQIRAMGSAKLAKQTVLEHHLKASTMPLKEAVRMAGLADSEERPIVGRIMRDKLKSAQSAYSRGMGDLWRMPPSERQELIRKAREIIEWGHEPIPARMLPPAKRDASSLFR